MPTASKPARVNGSKPRCSTALVQTYWQAAIAMATGVAPKAMGSAHPLNAPYQAFETSDKWIVVGGANQKHWGRTLEVLGATELARDPRFATGADRMGHLKELEALLTTHFKTRPAEYWLAALEEAGVPCGPVNDFQQVFSDPQVRSRGMEIKVDHPFEHALSLIRNPLTFSGTPIKDYRAPPLLGADTKEVLATIGIDDARLEKLKAQKIV